MVISFSVSEGAYLSKVRLVVRGWVKACSSLLKKHPCISSALHLLSYSRELLSMGKRTKSLLEKSSSPGLEMTGMSERCCRKWSKSKAIFQLCPEEGIQNSKCSPHAETSTANRVLRLHITEALRRSDCLLSGRFLAPDGLSKQRNALQNFLIFVTLIHWIIIHDRWEKCKGKLGYFVQNFPKKIVSVRILQVGKEKIDV